MITDAELDALVGAWERRDAEAVAAGGAAIGVAFTLEGLVALEPKLRNSLGRRDVMVTIAAALDAEHGLGLREVKNRQKGWTDGKDYCLAVKTEAAITVDVRHARNLPMTVSDVWGALRPWYRELRRNRARVEAWVATAVEPPDGRVSFALIAQPTATRGAPDVAALRAEIVAAPDDDRPRLVLADVLTELGDPQGELITLQLRLEALPHWTQDRHDPALGEERKALQARVKAILDAHRARIAGEVAERATTYDLRRGFVDEVTMAAPTFARHGERLFSMHPISTLRLRPLSPESLAKLAATPSLARVRRLQLRLDIGAERDIPMLPLGRSPHLASLIELGIDNCRTTAADWEATFAVLDAPRLTTVGMVAENGIRALAGLGANPRLSSLREVRFRPGWSRRALAFEDIAAAATAMSRGAPPSLERLELEDMLLLPEHVAQLLDGGARYRLRHLGLEGSTIGDPAAVAIASAPGSAELRTLELSRTAITDAGFVRLLQLPRLEKLQSYANKLTDEQGARVVEALRALPASHPLRIVGISNVTIPPDLAARFTSPE